MLNMILPDKPPIKKRPEAVALLLDENQPVSASYREQKEGPGKIRRATD
jgi:hypothetical protein